jgi:uncharacterized cysteine cluster protein YcgN (CxxCxxCC family)
VVETRPTRKFKNAVANGCGTCCITALFVMYS